jgi:hypothetical protein
LSAFRVLLAADKHNLNLLKVALAHAREARALALEEEAQAQARDQEAKGAQARDQARALFETYRKPGGLFEHIDALAAEMQNREPAPGPQPPPGPAKGKDNANPDAPEVGQAPGLPELPKAGMVPFRSQESPAAPPEQANERGASCTPPDGPAPPGDPGKRLSGNPFW